MTALRAWFFAVGGKGVVFNLSTRTERDFERCPLILSLLRTLGGGEILDDTLGEGLLGELKT